MEQESAGGTVPGAAGAGADWPEMRSEGGWDPRVGLAGLRKDVNFSVGWRALGEILQSGGVTWGLKGSLQLLH